MILIFIWLTFILKHEYGFDMFHSLCVIIDELKKLPAPEVAVKYYTEGDLYLFGKFYLSQRMAQFFCSN